MSYSLRKRWALRLTLFPALISAVLVADEGNPHVVLHLLLSAAALLLAYRIATQRQRAGAEGKDEEERDGD